MQNELPEIKNFASVWERVERKSEEKDEKHSPLKAPLDFKKLPRPVRFLPKF